MRGVHIRASSEDASLGSPGRIYREWPYANPDSGVHRLGWREGADYGPTVRWPAQSVTPMNYISENIFSRDVVLEGSYREVVDPFEYQVKGASWFQQNASTNGYTEVPSSRRQISARPMSMRQYPPATLPAPVQETIDFERSQPTPRLPPHVQQLMLNFRSQVGPGQLVGLHLSPKAGLRVRPVKRELAHSGGGPGMITVVNEVGDACFVKWDHFREECGWYRCGAHGQYTLMLVDDPDPDSKEQESIQDPLRKGGNSEKEVQER